MKETIALYKNPQGLLGTTNKVKVYPIVPVTRWEKSDIFNLYQEETGLQTPDIDAYLKDYNDALKELEDNKGDAVDNTWKQRKKRFNRKYDATIELLNNKYIEGVSSWYSSKLTKIGSITITFRKGIDKWQKEKAIKNVFIHLNIKSLETLRKIPNVKSVDFKKEELS